MHRDLEADVDADPAPLDLPPAEPESAGEKVLQKTPWWSISTGLHVVAALVLGWFWAVSAPAAEEAVLVNPPRRAVKPPEMERPRDVTDKPQTLDIPQESEHVVYVKTEDHSSTESPDDEDFKKVKGDSLDMVSDKPFQGKGTYDVIGGGGGGGGRYGTRFGGRKKAIQIGGGGGTEDAVLAALRWLARHQGPDGAWSTTGYTARCSKACTPNPGHDDFDAGNTGLALLAFLGAGYSHLSKDSYDGICFGDVVRKGLQWMMTHQDPEGCIGSRSVQKYMYNHLLCALAICEGFGLTGSNLFKDQAQKAVDFTVASQNPGRGWRYSYKCGDNDSSVTGWAVMVLKSAEISGLAIPPSGYTGSRAWLDETTSGDYHRVGYTGPNTGKVFIPGLNEQFDHNEALTAIGVMSRIFMDKRKEDPRLTNGCDLLLRAKPEWNGNAIDFYYWYYASLALFQFDGPVGGKWRSWNEPMKKALVEHQNLRASGCRNGSWEPVDRWSCEGGRVYATAINALTLEVYYRYANVFGGPGAK
jgi:hypothetical protein